MFDVAGLASKMSKTGSGYEYLRKNQIARGPVMIYGEFGPRTEKGSLSLDKRVTKGPHSWPFTHSTSVWEKDLIREGPLQLRTHARCLNSVQSNYIHVTLVTNCKRPLISARMRKEERLEFFRWKNVHLNIMQDARFATCTHGALLLG